MTDTVTVREKLRAFIQENFLYMRPDLQFTDDDSLLAKGVIDSLGVLEVVGFVEETWEVKVEQTQVTEQNFGTVSAIAGFVSNLVSGSRAG